MQKNTTNLKNTAIFLEKHYRNSKNTTNITPCRPPVDPLSTPCPVRTTGGRPPVPPVLAAPLDMCVMEVLKLLHSIKLFCFPTS